MALNGTDLVVFEAKNGTPAGIRTPNLLVRSQTSVDSKLPVFRETRQKRANFCLTSPPINTIIRQQPKTGGSMSVAKRKTSKGETSEYHYRVMVNGKRYVGVCEGCLTKKEALAYEEERKRQLSELAAQKSVKALVENFRDQLTGGTKIPLADAFELSLKKPSRRQGSEKQIEQKRTVWRDFVAFMTALHPEATNLADVTIAHAEGYIQQLRAEGRFDKGVKPKKMRAYTVNSKLSPKSVNIFHGALSETFAKLSNDARAPRKPIQDHPQDRRPVGIKGGVHRDGACYDLQEPHAICKADFRRRHSHRVARGRHLHLEVVRGGS